MRQGERPDAPGEWFGRLYGYKPWTWFIVGGSGERMWATDSAEAPRLWHDLSNIEWDLSVGPRYLKVFSSP